MDAGEGGGQQGRRKGGDKAVENQGKAVTRQLTRASSCVLAQPKR